MQEKLDPKHIDKLFGNVEKTKSDIFDEFLVTDKNGNETALIAYMGSGEWRIRVDNFPLPRKYFSTNLPILNAKQLIDDVARTGIELIPIAT